MIRATSRTIHAVGLRILSMRPVAWALPRCMTLVERLGPRKEVPSFSQIAACFAGKNGLEIGGPSALFGDRSLLPLYGIAASCDNCNFSGATIWQGAVKEGMTFKYHRRKAPGRQFLCEASSMPDIPDETYDFVIASHVIEHVANPIKALFEWKRVVRTGGTLLLVCPHKEGTFDHNRPTTRLSHLIDDYGNHVDETDLTHVPEILELHDLSLDPQAGSRKQFAARSARNSENRCLHHHVFTTESWVGLLDYLALETVALAAARPFHIIAAARKVKETSQSLEGLHASNVRFMSMDAAWRRESPFTADKTLTGENKALLRT